MDLVNPEGVMAESTLGPDAALQELLAGNVRFAAGCMTAPEQGLDILKPNTNEKQEPFSPVPSCADWYVPGSQSF